jgi:hypothetical protein
MGYVNRKNRKCYKKTAGDERKQAIKIKGSKDKGVKSHFDLYAVLC